MFLLVGCESIYLQPDLNPSNPWAMADLAWDKGESWLSQAFNYIYIYIYIYIYLKFILFLLRYIYIYIYYIFIV